MTESEWRPRLSIEITEEQFLSLQQLIPHGLRKAIFSCIIDDLIIMLKTDPSFIVGAILARELKLDKIMKHEG